MIRASWIGAIAAAFSSLSFAEPPQPMQEPAYVVVTHAQIGRAGRLSFALASIRLVGKMEGTPGLLFQDQGIRRLGAEVWTMTAWESPDAMRSWVRSPAHAAAMQEAAFAIRSMRTFHLRCERAAPRVNWSAVKGLGAGEIPQGCVLLPAAAGAPAAVSSPRGAIAAYAVRGALNRTRRTDEGW